MAQGFFPARQRLVDRFHARQTLHVRRHRVERLALEPITDAHGNLGEGIEHVELGHGKPGEAVHADGVAYHDGVEPTAAARSPGGCPEFVSQLPDPVGHGRLRLGGERPVAHTSRVRLDDPQHGIDGRGSDARADRRSTGGRIGGRDVRVGAVVHVEQRALGTLEQHRLAALQRFPDDSSRIHRQRKEPWRQPLQELHVCCRVGTLGGSQQCEEFVRRLHAPGSGSGGRPRGSPGDRTCPRTSGRCPGPWSRSSRGLRGPGRAACDRAV